MERTAAPERRDPGIRRGAAPSGPHADLTFYLTAIRGTPLLSAEEERDLGWRVINDGDEEAKERMVRANLRLVVAISRDFLRHGGPALDLIAEGNIGLIRAVERFDPARGTRFSTYASWWIRQSIMHAALGTRHTVRIPAYMVEILARWSSACGQLESELGRPPQPRELARALGVSARAIERAGLVREMFRAHGAGSPDCDEAPSLSEVLVDDGLERPEETVGRREAFVEIERLLDTIDARAARVVRLRYGLEGRAPMTLIEIGRELGVTRERVRQIEQEALGRLRRKLDAA
jgi:RNA polymerase primary sigma factor